jgi:hypothetical protein
VPAEAAEQIGADRMKEVIAIEVQGVDQRQRRIWSCHFRQRDGAVQCHDRTRRERHQVVVQLKNLPPVGLGGACGSTRRLPTGRIISRNG